MFQFLRLRVLQLVSTSGNFAQPFYSQLPLSYYSHKSSDMSTKQRLVLSIIDFLNQSIQDGTVKQDDQESLEVASTSFIHSEHD